MGFVCKLYCTFHYIGIVIDKATVSYVFANLAFRADNITVINLNDLLGGRATEDGRPYNTPPRPPDGGRVGANVPVRPFVRFGISTT
ncbi:MAG: hypothetical protein FWG68_11585 [Defluviitaleaceae bacterium]|nr:hypothetical protein [Defluviitaleaceae bacterium]